MNITFTKEELTEYSKRLGEWHSRELDAIATAIYEISGGASYRVLLDRETIVRAREKFAKENPKPDWRMLL